MRGVVAWMGCLTVVLAGCNLSPDPGTGDDESVGLAAFRSAEDLDAYFRGELSQRGGSVALPIAEDEGVSSDADGAADGLGGGGLGGGGLGGGGLNNGGPPAAAPEPSFNEDGAGDFAPSDAVSGRDGVSQTTTQESGVEESDVVKTDGDYLYIMAHEALRIVRATPAEAMSQVSETSIEGYGEEIYLREGQVVVLSTTYEGGLGGPAFDDFGGVGSGVGIGVVEAEEVSTPPAPGGDSDGAIGEMDSGGDAAGAAPGMGSEPNVVADIDVAPDFVADPDIAILPRRFGGPMTVVTVIDVSDPAAPVVESTTKVSGGASSSRMIDGKLHMAIANYEYYFMGMAPFLGTADFRVDAVDTRMLLPRFEQELADGSRSEGTLVTWDSLYRPSRPDGFGVVAVVSMDTSDSRLGAVGLVAEPGLIYSSRDALYLTNTEYDFSGTMRESTTIYKFEYGVDRARPVAAGTVPGRILNQYSMGEHEGFLRVATTVGPIFSRDDDASRSSNNVYVLGERGDSLEIVGRVENIAPGETIQSARFMGDRGYVVTFEFTDPLFTLDLSEPTAPRVVGEIEVPGFSTFITPMDEDHLLTVGQFVPLPGFFSPPAVQLSIFDVSDFANPVRTHNLVVAEEIGSFSEAIFNPKAFTYLREEGLVALPVSIVDFGGFLEVVDFETLDSDDVTTDDTSFDDGATDGGMSMGGGGSADLIDEPRPVEPVGDAFVEVLADAFHGLVVFEVSAEDGFNELGRIRTTAEDAMYYDVPAFTRGVFIGDFVYAVSDRGVRAALIDLAEEIVGQVDFPRAFDFPIPVDGDFAIANEPAMGGVER